MYECFIDTDYMIRFIILLLLPRRRTVEIVLERDGGKGQLTILSIIHDITESIKERKRKREREKNANMLL